MKVKVILSVLIAALARHGWRCNRQFRTGIDSASAGVFASYSKGIAQILLWIVLAWMLILSACTPKKNETQTSMASPEASQSQTPTVEYKIDDTIPSDLKTLELDFGFDVTIGQSEEFKGADWYDYFKLERNGNVIFISYADYEFGDKNYPMILQTGVDSYELLFEINSRPGNNRVKRLFVRNDKLTEEDELPIFVNSEPRDINGDGIKEYAGYKVLFEYGAYDEEAGNYTTFYNPLIYYSLTETGLKLDTLLTQQRNEIIFGHFYGLEPDYDIELPGSVVDKFAQELEIISGKQ
jgi:hypothetical protein